MEIFIVIISMFAVATMADMTRRMAKALERIAVAQERLAGIVPKEEED